MRFETILVLGLALVGAMFATDRAIAVREKQEKAQRVDRVIDMVEDAIKPTVKVSVQERRMFHALNADRARYHRPPLVIDPRLQQLARDRARVMNPNNAHEPGGVWPGTAVKRSGYPLAACAENFAWSFDTPEGAVNGWKQSSGHARAQRGPYTHVGVGIYGRSYVAIFARPQ